jgi:hypothetical protein
MSVGLIIAMVIAAYSTMFIMTYLSLYIYDYKQDMGNLEKHGREFYMEFHKNTRITYSFIWFLFIPILIILKVCKGVSYVTANFFNILDTIGSKITK